MKTTILYVLTKNSYGAAFISDSAETLSDQRNDANRAAHFRTATSAEKFARGNFGEYWERNYSVERLFKTDAGLFCEVFEVPGEEGTTVIKYHGETFAGLSVS